MTEPRKLFAIYAITKHGIDIAKKLTSSLPTAHLFVSSKLFASAPPGSRKLSLPMGPTLRETFHNYDCHVFIISVGAVVRMIAPLLKDKKTDPAVICMDDDARFSICVLSGHVGRGNLFANRIAGFLDAQPVVTTASDVRGTLTVDILGRSLGWMLDDMDRNVTQACAAVVNETRVLFVQETGEPNWWPEDQPLPPGVEYATSLANIDPNRYEILLIASDRLVSESHPGHYENSVVFRPKSLVLGLGCDSETPADLIERGMQELFRTHNLSIKSIKSIASIDLKKEEPGLNQLADKYGWPFITYGAPELDVVPGIQNPSKTVKKYVGTRAVAEPAALLAAGAQKLLVTKTKYTEPGVSRNVTFAVARIPFRKRKRVGVHA